MGASWSCSPCLPVRLFSPQPQPCPCLRPPAPLPASSQAASLLSLESSPVVTSLRKLPPSALPPRGSTPLAPFQNSCHYSKKSALPLCCHLEAPALCQALLDPNRQQLPVPERHTRTSSRAEPLAVRTEGPRPAPGSFSLACLCLQPDSGSGWAPPVLTHFCTPEFRIRHPLSAQ